MAELSRIFFQARSQADAPAVGADVYILRRGASVDSGSTATLIKSKDPGCLYSGDVVRIVRDGDVLEGTGAIELTLTSNPAYDILNGQWDITVTYTEVWTPQDGDRLVLKEDAANQLNVYEDSEAEILITQPTTLTTLATYEAWCEISGYDICLAYAGNYQYITSGVDTLRGFVTPEDFGALGLTYPEDSLAWQRAMDFAHSTNTKIVRALAKKYYCEDLKGRIGVHIYGGGYYDNPVVATETGTEIRPQPTPPGVGVSESVIAWRGNQGPGADWEDDRLTGFSVNDMTIRGLTADNRPVVLLEDCSLFRFKNVYVLDGGRNAFRLLGCWDARFDNIRIGNVGSVDGLYPGIYMGDSASLADTNNLYFNDIVCEAYLGAAIGIEGAGPNEIVFNTCKVESNFSSKTDVWIKNGKNIRFNSLQITGKVDKPTEHLISFDNCENCYGDIHVEHVGSVTCDHYVQLNATCERNRLDVIAYGFDNSLNGIVGDDNPNANYIDVIPVTTPVIEHPQSTKAPATKHRFESEDGELEIEMVRKDYPTVFHLGQIKQDGATAFGLWEFLADTNRAFKVNKDGNVTFDQDVTISQNIDVLGEIKNTGAGGYVKVEESWDDLRVQFNSVKIPATGAPSFEQIQTGIWAYHFLSGADAEVYFTVQLPHTYVEGTDLKPHLHWIPNSVDTGTVTFEFDYIIQNVNGTFPAKTTTTTTLNAPGVVGQHTIFALPTIPGSTLNVSACIVGTLRRKGTTDTHTGKVAAISLDFHMKVNSIGSDLEFTKT